MLRHAFRAPAQLNRLPRLLGKPRFLSLSGKIRYNDEVASALEQSKPVVALESTIITHGLPYPDNLNMALEVEGIIRDEGAVPATIAFVDGMPTVGLKEDELKHLAAAKGAHKVSRRDVSHVMSRGLTGGTTIAGTMILANLAGIDVFATGGLGGVHRDVERTWDISADLEELGRTPVGVVCSGPKSILDIPKTMEYLETKGVHVSTYGPPGTNVPGFFTSDSGVSSLFNFQTPEQAARILLENSALGIKTGAVFCNPVPKDLELDKEFVDGVIIEALKEAEKLGIQGKNVTPFLLKKIWEQTKGDSLTTNVAFVKNNARLGSKIAVSLSSLKRGADKPVSKAMPDAGTVGTDIRKRQQGDQVDALIVGAIAYDLTCTMKTFIAPGILIGSSHPSSIASSIGGVAHNVALAAQYASESGSGAKVRLVSTVGSDSKAILDLVSHSLDISGINVDQQQPTPKYVSVNDVRGQLVVACADMDLIENMSTEHITSEIKRAQPKVVLLDGNLGMKQTKTVLETARSIPGCLVMFEPTSEFKASLMSRLPLQLFPHCSIDIATPNYIELGGMYNAFEKSSKFTGDRWRQITNAIGLKQQIKFASDDLSEKIPELNPLIRSGLIDHAFHLLPYFPNLFVKLGQRGIINFQLFENMDAVRQPSKGTELEGNNRFVSSISIWGEKNMGILIQHFPPYPLGNTPVVSVNGAGDTLCGTLLSELARDHEWLADSQDRKIAVMERAQQAAVLSLGTMNSVSPDIRHLYPKSNRR